MGKRLTFLFTILIGMTMFALYGALVTTVETNDHIIEQVENFVETVRYKGCVTENAYYELINGFDVPVEVRFTITRQSEIGQTGDTLEFTQDVIDAFNTDADGDGKVDKIYKMNVGDTFSVIVRKPSGNLYDRVVGATLGDTSGTSDPVIAMKGGMILNTQYKNS